MSENQPVGDAIPSCSYADTDLYSRSVHSRTAPPPNNSSHSQHDQHSIEQEHSTTPPPTTSLTADPHSRRWLQEQTTTATPPTTLTTDADVYDSQWSDSERDMTPSERDMTPSAEDLSHLQHDQHLLQQEEHDTLARMTPEFSPDDEWQQCDTPPPASPLPRRHSKHHHNYLDNHIGYSNHHYNHHNHSLGHDNDSRHDINNSHNNFYDEEADQGVPLPSSSNSSSIDQQKHWLGVKSPEFSPRYSYCSVLGSPVPMEPAQHYHHGHHSMALPLTPFDRDCLEREAAAGQKTCEKRCILGVSVFIAVATVIALIVAVVLRNSLIIGSSPH